MTSVLADRRQVLGGAVAAGLAVALWPAGAPATAAGVMPGDYESALKSILGDAQAAEGRLTLELPEIAENGNTVPFSVAVDSPMTAESHVRAIHLLSTANPQPVVASFHLSLLSGVGKVAGRMRLAKTQDVVAIAELSDGSFAIGRRNVKVTIGGCGG